MKKSHIYASLFLMSAIVAFGVDAQITIPTQGWLINTKEKTCRAEMSHEQAPDGSNAIRIKFDDSNTAANITMSLAYLAEAASNWPAVFNGLSGYVWNDGKNNIIRLSFKMEDGIYFHGFFKPDHTGWKLMTCEGVADFQHNNVNFNPSDTKSFFITIDQHPEAEIALGALSWTAEGTKSEKER